MKTKNILSLIFVFGLLCTTFSCETEDNDPLKGLTNQIEIDGTKYDLTNITYYHVPGVDAPGHTEFMFENNGMFDVTDDLITGKKIDAATVTGENSRCSLEYHANEKGHISFYSFDKGITGWIKVIQEKQGTGNKYTVSFELKNAEHTAKAMFTTLTGESY